MTDVEVELMPGTIRGVAEGGVVRFLGIPFAAALDGDMWMRPPTPVVPWTGVRDASEYGPTVPKAQYALEYQRLFPEPTIPGNECLNLNVWAPLRALGQDSSLPVLV